MSPATPKTLARAIAIGAVACVVARLPWQLAAGGMAHLALAQELVLAAAASALAALAFRGQSSLARDGVTLLVAALVALELVSALAATNAWAALRASAMIVAGAATFFVARANGVSAALLAVPALVAGSVVLEAFGVVSGLSRSGHAPGGFLGERNAASELLVAALPFVVAMAVRRPERRVRAFATAVAGVSVAAIVLSRTRSAWLALGALSLLALVLVLRAGDATRERAAPVLVASIVLGGLAVVVPNALAWTEPHPYHATLLRLVDAGSPSAHGRWVQNATTLKLALAHPLLGVGPGNWAGQYLAVASPGDPSLHAGLVPTNRLPQSDLFGFAAERGLVALVLVGALVVSLARGTDEDRWLRRATLLAVAIVGTFDAVLQVAPHLFFAAAVLGGALPRATSSGPSAPVRDRRFAAFAIALAPAAILAALRVSAFAHFVRAEGFADYERAALLDRGDVAQRLAIASDYAAAGRCDDAERHLAAARSLAVLGDEANAITCERSVSYLGTRQIDLSPEVTK